MKITIIWIAALVVGAILGLFANTTSLLRYTPNCVKIDRLLIQNLQEDPRKQHFVKNIIEFAHDNKFMALAEGVETAEELKVIHSNP